MLVHHSYLFMDSLSPHTWFDSVRRALIESVTKVQFLTFDWVVDVKEPVHMTRHDDWVTWAVIRTVFRVCHSCRFWLTGSVAQAHQRRQEEWKSVSLSKEQKVPFKEGEVSYSTRVASSLQLLSFLRSMDYRRLCETNDDFAVSGRNTTFFLFSSFLHFNFLWHYRDQIRGELTSSPSKWKLTLFQGWQWYHSRHFCKRETSFCSLVFIQEDGQNRWVSWSGRQYFVVQGVSRINYPRKESQPLITVVIDMLFNSYDRRDKQELSSCSRICWHSSTSSVLSTMLFSL
jgi:hypothetical protein